MIKLKTLLQEITVLPRRELNSLDVYQARPNQDITWLTEEGPYDLPADYAIYVVKVSSNMYYLADILSGIPYREVFVIPARYLSNIFFIESVTGEILAEVNSKLATAKYIIAKPGEG